MSDLVERLRKVEGIGAGWGLPILDGESLDITCKRAADEIERLRGDRDEAVRFLRRAEAERDEALGLRDAFAARNAQLWQREQVTIGRCDELHDLLRSIVYRLTGSEDTIDAAIIRDCNAALGAKEEG